MLLGDVVWPRGNAGLIGRSRQLKVWMVLVWWRIDGLSYATRHRYNSVEVPVDVEKLAGREKGRSWYMED